MLAAVTADPRPVQGCRVVPLGKMRYLSVATPEYAERWLTGKPLPEALAEAPMMVFNAKDMLQHRLIRKVTRRRLDPPTHAIPAPGPFHQAVRIGLGWGMIEDEVAEPELAAGRLVEVAPGKYVDVPLYWQHWKLESGILDALTAAVLRARRRPGLNPAQSQRMAIGLSGGISPADISVALNGRTRSCSSAVRSSPSARQPWSARVSVVSSTC